MKRLGLQSRLTLIFLFIGIIPFLGVSIYSYNISKKIIVKREREGLNSLHLKNKMILTDISKNISHDVKVFGENSDIVKSFSELNEGFNNLESDVESVDENTKTQLMQYYNDKVVPSYSNSNDVSLHLKSFSKIDKKATILQSGYVSSFNGDFEKNNLLEKSKYNTAYDNIHSNIHPKVRRLLVDTGLKNVYVLDSKGNIFYMFNKRVGLGQNINNLKETHSVLFNNFNILKSGKSSFQFTDFEPFMPNGGELTSFLGTQLGDSGNFLFFEIDSPFITNAINKPEHKKIRESFLVSNDGTLRSHSYFLNKGEPREYFKSGKKLSYDSFKKSLKASDDTIIRGEQVMRSFSEVPHH